MEPPSPLISWVNPFPSRFIIEQLVSREKCHISVSLVCHREKNEAGWSRTQKPVLRPFSFLLYVHFYDFTAAWIWVSWNKSWWITRQWSDGTKSELRITVRLSLPVFLFVIIHSTLKHALRKESTIKRSVDESELFDEQRRKFARIMSWLEWIPSAFRQLSTACKSDA